jgi:hypothetical protein
MKQLIITGDDFGLNHQVNEAIERDHQRGILTQASLLVTGAAVDEAVQIARRNSGMCVGIHLDLLNGQSPAAAGLHYFFGRAARERAQRQIIDQFEQFLAVGFSPIYWDGHAHLHLHPTLLRLTLPIARNHCFRVTRLVREPGWTKPLLPIFRALSAYAVLQLLRYGIAAADETFGLNFSGRATTARICAILPRISAPWTELYYHPGADLEKIDARVVLDEIERLGLRPVNSRHLAQSAARQQQPVAG